MNGLAGRVALVTGSTSGIGLAVAQALAAEGADVMLNGFADPDALDALVARFGSSGVRVAHHGADVSRPEQVEALVAAVHERFGGLDVLVNNAGIQHVDPVERFPTERWDAIIATNLNAAFHAIRAALPGMRARGWGRIVNVASVHGLVASPFKSAYVAAKHGLVGLTKVVALETAGTAITCNAVCPGYVLTPLIQAQIDAIAARDGRGQAAAREALLGGKHPSGAFVAPEQVAAMVVYLCSQAAAQVRGAALTIDGGWVAQ